MSEKTKKAFHPGYYIKEYLEDIQMTQDEFAKRVGISGKQISLIIKESASITPDIAFKLSKLMGTSIEMWLNLQTKYDSYKIQQESLSAYEEEKEIYKMIDKDFLINLKIIDSKDDIDTAISKLRQASFVSSLTLHKTNDIFCFYRISNNKNDNINNTVCRNVWVSIASSIAKKDDVKPFDEKKLLENIGTFRSMTTNNHCVFYPKLINILNDSGVSFVVLPSLKNSNINGVVKWIDSQKVMMALNTRGSYNDRFWFSFFHELKHVLQKSKRKTLISQEVISEFEEVSLEYEADYFAKESLIPSSELDKLLAYDENSVIEFANKINIHPGIVVGRLQKEQKIKYSQLNHLKEKYEIIIN